MPMDQSITEEFPILDGDDDKVVNRLRKARKRLQKVFTELFLAENVIVVCVEALKHQSADNDLEIATVLRRYVDSVLGEQLVKLNKVITKFEVRPNSVIWTTRRATVPLPPLSNQLHRARGILEALQRTLRWCGSISKPAMCSNKASITSWNWVRVSPTPRSLETLNPPNILL